MKRKFEYTHEYDGHAGMTLDDFGKVIDHIREDFARGGQSPRLRMSVQYPGPQSNDNTVRMTIVAEDQ